MLKSVRVTKNSNSYPSQYVRDTLEDIKEFSKQSRPKAVLLVRSRGMKDHQGFIIPEDEASHFLELIRAAVMSVKSLYPGVPLVVLLPNKKSVANEFVISNDDAGTIIKWVNLVDVLKKEKDIYDVIDVKKLNRWNFIDLFNLDTDN